LQPLKNQSINMAYLAIPIQSIKFKDSVPSEIKNLYNFALENNFDEFTTLSMIRKKLKENFKVEIDNYATYSRILNDFSFFNKDNYMVDDSFEDIYDVSNLLNQIKEEVLYFTNPESSKVFNGYILKRQINPPLEAFEPVGHNKLNIKPSGRDSALLYE